MSELLNNFIDDVYVVCVTIKQFRAHHDLYNLSVLVGKLIKACFFFYITELFWKPDYHCETCDERDEKPNYEEKDPDSNYEQWEEEEGVEDYGDDYD